MAKQIPTRKRCAQKKMNKWMQLREWMLKLKQKKYLQLFLGTSSWGGQDEELLFPSTNQKKVKLSLNLQYTCKFC